MTEKKDNTKPPYYILATPRERDVPEIIASADRQDLLKELKISGEYIYRLTGVRI
jgi:hypothetical protein